MGRIEVPAGLESVVVTTTAVSRIDGDPDSLLYRGYDVQELAHESSYEEVTYLILESRLPNPRELEEFTLRLRRARSIPAPRLELLEHLPKKMTPVDALITMLSVPEDPGTRPAIFPWDVQGLAGRLLSESATIVASFCRARGGQPVPEPRADLGPAANFLYLLRGSAPTPDEERALDQTMLLHADNELNTSTFAARVAASTGADMVSAVVAGLSTLKGPLHGGASVAVARQVQEIGSAGNAEAYVERKFSAGERITGFGHRVYRQEDPRATVLREISRDLSKSLGRTEPFATLEALEAAVRKRKPLPVNLDLYSSCVFQLLEIPPELFTPIFALARMPGWVAHIREEYAQRKLVSPLARYTGAEPRKYLPMSQRP